MSNRPPCWYCGHPADNMDHVVPKRKGGTRVHNLVHACYGCNSRKGVRSLESFRFAEYCRANKIPVFTFEQVTFLQSIDPVPTFVVEASRFTFFAEREGYADRYLVR